MSYTEVQEKNGRKYYYRVKSVRDGSKVSKKRVYLGVDLKKAELIKREKESDIELLLLSTLLTPEQINELEKVKKEKSSLAYESFLSLFTHNSTAIEGNTFTLQETAQLLFEQITPRKSLREINEIVNHKKAFNYLLGYKKDITKQFLLHLHKLVVQDTIPKQTPQEIGIYRTHQVFIRGVEWLPSKPEDVSKEIKQLLSWYTIQKKKLHPLIVAAYVHVTFEMIHPFIDGNGRVGRLLLNFILHKNGYPMINIPHKQRYVYYRALEIAQVKNDLRPIVDFLYKLMLNSKIRF